MFYGFCLSACVSSWVFFISKNILICFLLACLFSRVREKDDEELGGRGSEEDQGREGGIMIRTYCAEKNIFNKKKSQNVRYIEHVVQWPPDLDSQQRLSTFFQCYAPFLLGAVLSMKMWPIYQQEMTSQISGQH